MIVISRQAMARQRKACVLLHLLHVDSVARFPPEVTFSVSEILILLCCAGQQLV